MLHVAGDKWKKFLLIYILNSLSKNNERSMFIAV